MHIILSNYYGFNAPVTLGRILPKDMVRTASVGVHQWYFCSQCYFCSVVVRQITAYSSSVKNSYCPICFEHVRSSSVLDHADSQPAREAYCDEKME